MGDMHLNKHNFAQEEMMLFYELSNKYYPNRKKEGIFLDLGANIGTTCIYFKKKIDSDINILAFEPLKENFKYLDINLRLNDITEGVTIEQFGLAEKSYEKEISVLEGNPGGSSLIRDYGNMTRRSEVTNLISLDEYFEKNNLKAEDVKYMWIDTEGFEPQVLKGASSILSQNDFPVFVEFNPYLYKTYGTFDEFINFLEENFRKYIKIPERLEGKEILHDISELNEYKNLESDQFFDAFFIK